MSTTFQSDDLGAVEFDFELSDAAFSVLHIDIELGAVPFYAGSHFGGNQNLVVVDECCGQGFVSFTRQSFEEEWLIEAVAELFEGDGVAMVGDEVGALEVFGAIEPPFG